MKGNAAMPADAPPHTPPSTPARLRRVPVPVVVRLAEKRVTLAEVRALAPGSLLTFEKGCEEPLDLFVANRRLARGEAGEDRRELRPEAGRRSRRGVRGRGVSGGAGA